MSEEIFLGNIEELTGGEWKTISGTHVYIKDGKIVAGPGATTGKKAQPKDQKVVSKKIQHIKKSETEATRKGAGLEEDTSFDKSFLPDLNRDPASLSDIKAAFPGVKIAPHPWESKHIQILEVEGKKKDADQAAARLREMGWEVIHRQATKGVTYLRTYPLKKAETPETAYHLVPEHLVDQILKEGLKPGSKERTTKKGELLHSVGKVFLSSDYHSMYDWETMLSPASAGKTVLLKVDLRGVKDQAYKDQLTNFDEGAIFFAGKKIPPGRLSVVEKPFAKMTPEDKREINLRGLMKEFGIPRKEAETRLAECELDKSGFSGGCYVR